jgi:polyphosphate kinase
MNALVDADVIEALYRASQAGVPITLSVRGICCLRPGVPRVSETIEVRAMIDRFLEHGRAFHFANGGKDEVYISSADWMPRNFHRRVETLIPLEDPAIRTRLIELLQTQALDTAKTWLLKPDGKYERVQLKAGQTPFRAQARFIELARDRVKAAEAGATSARFPLARFTGARPPKTDDKSDGRRSRRELRDAKKGH